MEHWENVECFKRPIRSKDFRKVLELIDMYCFRQIK